MDAVKAFNVEMLSMMDMQPPISRAKMMSITKAGIKAIKLYKHVVQIIEKFIKRCGPELKVPGLYVVDSIIRQSRHQFGEDKDVFGPRFLKNMTDTFHSLYQCPPDDKAKILRVLNLWQKNSVFGMDVIQPLLDMAAGPVTPVLENGITLGGSPAAQLPSVSVPVTLDRAVSTAVFPETSNPAALPHLQNPGSLPQQHNLAALPHLPQLQNASAPPQNPSALSAVTQFLQSAQGFNLQQVLQTLANAQSAAQTAAPIQQKSSIAKVLQDRFEYDEEPDVMEEPNRVEVTPAVSATVNLEALQRALQAHLIGQLSSQVFPDEQATLQCLPGSQSVTGLVPAAGQPALDQVSQFPGPSETLQTQNHSHTEAQLPDIPQEFRPSRRDERDARYSRRSRSRSPRRQSSSRSQRSRSGSRSQRSRFRRSRSRSRDRRRGSLRRRAEDRQGRERKHKGLPPIKKETLSVCSTTLWIGQLDKKTQQQDITCLMEEFGQIESVNMIPPRGCAYVVMVHRQDAYTSLSKLSRGSAKINHKPFKIAWALNKGVNSRFKKYWDVELGVTYIPWTKLKAAEIAGLREGGTLDQDTFKPEWMPELEDLLKPAGDGPGERPEGEAGEGAAVATAGSQESAVTVDETRSPAAGTPTVTTPPHTHPAPDQPEAHAANPTEGTENQAESSRARLTTNPPAGTLVGSRPGHAPRPTGPQSPFAPPFLSNMPQNTPPVNAPHPNMPLMRMPQPVVSQGPMFRERPLRPAGPIGSMGPRGPLGPMGPRGPLGPPGRFRMPMCGPHEDFPHPREGFPPSMERFPLPRERFPHSGPMEEEHWDHGPFRNDWHDHGPNRGPEWFGEELPFRRGGWGPGGPRVRGRFEN